MRTTFAFLCIAVAVFFQFTESSSDRRPPRPSNVLSRPSPPPRFDPSHVEHIQIPDGIEIRFNNRIIGKRNGRFILPYCIHWNIIALKEPTHDEVSFKVEHLDDEAWLIVIGQWARKEQLRWVTDSAAETIVILHRKRIHQTRMEKGIPDNFEDEEPNHYQDFAIIETFDLPGRRFSHITVQSDQSQVGRSISNRFPVNLFHNLRSGGSQSNRY
ncbi:uncharacterized protein LOC117173129 [Belonocnema kinseyi]|uniref:uncharacterized protein LOC117173129 n=1 Tax=Belonocnema kinseyi TaxID=2817044 RepID=UPI00143DCA3C|nr:uncharacterized protein LOC117173129 [Belonocnema kinseyi]